MRAALQSERHDPFVDAMRGVAVSLVLGFHYFSVPPTPFIRLPILTPLFSFGFAGVQIFFVISGYLLGGQLIDHRREPGALKTFYARRIARIMPPYLILLAMIAVAFPTVDLRAPLTLTQNIIWAFFPEPSVSWLLPTWTLAVEEQFYLVLPALIFLVRPQRLTAVLSTICLLSFLLHFGLSHVASAKTAMYLLPSQASGFALGVLLAQWVRQRPATEWRLPAPRSLVWLGKRSYAVYLFHVPIADISGKLAGRGLPGLAIAFLATLGFAALLYVAVERPILNWARRRWRYSGKVSWATLNSA